MRRYESSLSSGGGALSIGAIIWRGLPGETENSRTVHCENVIESRDEPPMSGVSAGLRSDYRHFLTIPTRWMDNDIYGHVNNVTYYSYFDTVINRYLIEAGGLDIHKAPIIGITAESLCRFRRPFSFPEPVEAGLRVAHLGNS